MLRRLNISRLQAILKFKKEKMKEIMNLLVGVCYFFIMDFYLNFRGFFINIIMMSYLAVLFIFPVSSLSVVE